MFSCLAQSARTSSRRAIEAPLRSARVPSRNVSNVAPLGHASPVTYEAERKGAVEYALREGFVEGSFFEQPVVWGDIDQYQHVNNVRYARFFETGRMTFARHMASRLPAQEGDDLVKGKGVALILAGLSVKYRRPVTYPDTLLIAQKVKEGSLQRDRFILSGICYSFTQKAVVATSDADIVWYDYNTLKKADAPQVYQDVLKSFTAN